MHSSLWVGSLHGTAPRLEEHLWEVFRRHGEVLDIVIRPAPTPPDSYAIVTYASPSSAAAALHVLDRRSIPTLTDTVLKIRPWEEEAPPRPAPWRPQHHSQLPQAQHAYHAQQQQRWADAEEGSEGGEPDLPPHLRPARPQQQQQQHPPRQQRAFGSGWAAGAHQAAEEQEVYDEEEEGEWGEEESDEEDDPLVELWVGNLCSRATRVALRKAFELFGQVHEVVLQPAPNPRPHQDPGLQFAFITLPASAAETALEELDGLCVHELSGGAALQVRQSNRSLRPLQQWQARQAQRAQQRAQPQGHQQQQGGGGWAAVLEDGSVVPLQAPRVIGKRIVGEGVPSSELWVGNVGAHATREQVEALFSRYGQVQSVLCNQAPGGGKHGFYFQFCFVRLSSVAEAQRAHAALHRVAGLEICGGANGCKGLKLRYAWRRSSLVPWNGRAAGPTAPSAAAAAAQVAAPTGSRAAASHSSASRAAAAAPPDEPCCAACGAASSADGPLKRCSGCRAAYFCSRACQLKSWEAEHHRHCGPLAAFGKQLEEQQLPRELLVLLAEALAQPAGRQGRMVQAVVAAAAAAAEAG